MTSPLNNRLDPRFVAPRVQQRVQRSSPIPIPGRTSKPARQLPVNVEQYIETTQIVVGTKHTIVSTKKKVVQVRPGNPSVVVREIPGVNLVVVTKK